MMTKAEAMCRAQRIADDTGTYRYVNYTSLGWRIEYAPRGDLSYRVEPKKE